ncbi:Sulfatase [Planctomycetales bacterium 10988]|nr:Sulfatase [Planctomycetales bacterium 10988]
MDQSNHILTNLTRRSFLGNVTTGLAGVGLMQLLSGRGFAKETNWQPGQGMTHHPAKAKRVLQIFCPGAASHMDLWEYKPALEKWHGKPLPGAEDFLSFQGKNGNLMKSPWPFVSAGESGKMISSLLPHMAEHVDDIAFVHSLQSKTNTHGPGCVFMNTGHDTEGFPTAGAWLSYALGSENDNLPTYVAIPDIRGEPPNGKANWSNGFLPARHQAIMMSDQQPIRNLARPGQLTQSQEAASRELLSEFNQNFAAQNPAETELQARVAAYELAARMQLSAPEVSDLSKESPAVHQLYGTQDRNPLKAAYARNCLLARRLLERDVRYVNLFCASRASGVDGLLNWDAHKTLKPDYERHCPIFDQPTAALLTDLKKSGLLEDTLVLWTTEFGRMPTHQEGTAGRDHNPDGFTCWMMGAGVQGGVSYGATDEFGRRAEVNPSTVWDFYATVLHLLGFDHEKLTWYHNGLDRRLTDVHGHVLHDILT